MDHLVPDDKFSFYETTDREDMLINQRKPRLIGVRANGETMWTSKNDTFLFYSIKYAYKSALIVG